MKLLSLRLCRTRIHRSSTSRKSSGFRARSMLECSLGDRGSTYYILGLGQTDIDLCSVTSTAGASVEYTFKVSLVPVLSIVVVAYQLIRARKQLSNPRSTSQLTPKNRRLGSHLWPSGT